MTFAEAFSKWIPGLNPGGIPLRDDILLLSKHHAEDS